MKFRYPKRWSRERRKRARAFARHTEYVVKPALERCLDRVWGDALEPSPWLGLPLARMRVEGRDRPFIDDAEFLP